MHTVFYYEFIGLDWSWIPITDREKSCVSKGDAYRVQVSSLERLFKIAKIKMKLLLVLPAS